MTHATTVRRQRASPTLAFSHNLTTFLGHTALPQTPLTLSLTCTPSKSRNYVVETRPQDPNSPIVMVAAPPPKINTPRTRSRFTTPVPAPKPHEVLQPRRGRNSRRRIVEAEHFRKYIYLRRQLKPWSDAFRSKHGRTPSLIDVHASDIPGLMDRFIEYLEALDRLRVDV